jgi:hypothetical protein
MAMVWSRAVRRSRFSAACVICLLGTLFGCGAGPTEVGDGTLRVLVDRAGGTLRITNTGVDSVLVGVLGRALSVRALRIPCGSARVGSQDSVTLEIPANETEATVFYCFLSLPSPDGTSPERSFTVVLTK